MPPDWQAWLAAGRQVLGDPAKSQKWVYPASTEEPAAFDEIDPTLAVLDLCDPTVRDVQALRELPLREAMPESSRAEFASEHGVFRGV